MLDARQRLEFSTTPSQNPVPAQRRAEILADPGFGLWFTDHMVTAMWTPDAGWHDAGVRPYAPLVLDPATAVLHYAQAVFEGLKAYRHADGSIWTFRPAANGVRFARSAQRLALPELPVDDFVAAIDLLVRTDAEWVPPPTPESEASLYLRPFMFAAEVFLGVRPAKKVMFCLIASPVGPYFASGVKPVNIWLSEKFTRAAPGGTGAAKFAGNYAASLIAQQEAFAHGCDQVCFLDAVERRWVEELGGMNLYFVHSDGSIVTPELTGTILEGVTRASIVQLASDLGHKVEERRVGIDEWREGVNSGDIAEVFACGTAAVITPLGRLLWQGGELRLADEPGPVTMSLRTALLDVQYGRAEDIHGWLHRVV